MIPAAPAERAPAASLAISAAELTALLEVARGAEGTVATEQSLAALTAAGWVVDGALAGVLAEGLAALTAPVCDSSCSAGRAAVAGASASGSRRSSCRRRGRRLPADRRDDRLPARRAEAWSTTCRRDRGSPRGWCCATRRTTRADPRAV